LAATADESRCRHHGLCRQVVSGSEDEALLDRQGATNKSDRREGSERSAGPDEEVPRDAGPVAAGGACNTKVEFPVSDLR